MQGTRYDVGGNGGRGALVDSDKELLLHLELHDLRIDRRRREKFGAVRPFLSISVTDGHEYWKDFRGYHKEISSSDCYSVWLDDVFLSRDP